MLFKLKYSDIHKGNLILINKEYRLESERNELVLFANAGKDVLLEKKVSQVLTALFEEIQCGDSIVPVSGYRSYLEQKEIFDDSIPANGEEYTKKYVALPGHSEHQTGLAVDIGLNSADIDFICPDFPYEGICQTFRETAPRFGFIERYIASGVNKTGIGHEPWHFRYVGIPHAEYISIHGLVLEEYIELLHSHPKENPLEIVSSANTYSIFFIPVKPGEETELYQNEDNHYGISGNNIDGFIITEEKRFFSDLRGM